MSLFDLFKPKKDTKVKGVLLWLEAADEAYEQACMRRLTSVLGKFFKGQAVDYIVSKISHMEEDGEDLTPYRNVTFKRLKTKDGSSKYKRIVTYDDIKINNKTTISLGIPYAEKWTADTTDNLISDIKLLEE